MNDVRFTLRIDQNLADECDKHINKTNCRNRTEYIEKALSFYNEYLDSGEQLDFLVPVLSSIIKASVQRAEDRLARNMFKIAVELAKLSNITAGAYNVDDDTMRKMQIRCMEEVKKINGIIDFEEALKYQKS